LDRLTTAATLVEAHMLRDLLARAGIDAVVLNENAIGALGELPFAQAWPEIWIADRRDRPAAEDVLRRAREDLGEAERPCRHCDASGPLAFQICWSCGASLDD
jgi:hypothetical protein